jgi:hypothetical protein
MLGVHAPLESRQAFEDSIHGPTILHSVGGGSVEIGPS